MKKFAVIAGLAAVALLLGVAGTAVRSDEAQAKPTDVLSINPDLCYFLAVGDWTEDSNGDTVVDPDADADYACYGDGAVGGGGLDNPDNLADLATALDGDVDDPDTYADVAAAGMDQLNETWGELWVLAFVTNDDNVTLDADEGVFVSSGTSSVDCSADIGDEDCNVDGTKGDGVVVDNLLGNGVADRGDSQVDVFQDGTDEFLDYTVVGDPDDLEVAALQDTIQEDAGAACDVGDFADEIEEVDVAGLYATVWDDDGVQLAGIWVLWDSDDTDVLDLGEMWTVSMYIEDFGGPVAINLGCGDEIGTATVTAEDGWGNDDEVDITVIGEPADMTLTASPAAIACDGVASSTVTASLVDADGNPVVDGVEVRFEVVALGIADPILATTVGGDASSTITPLSGAAAGVVVMVTSGDLEDSIRVDCLAPAPTVAPPPPVTPVPPVVPPPTGSGGCLP